MSTMQVLKFNKTSGLGLQNIKWIQHVFYEPPARRKCYYCTLYLHMSYDLWLSLGNLVSPQNHEVSMLGQWPSASDTITSRLSLAAVWDTWAEKTHKKKKKLQTPRQEACQAADHYLRPSHNKTRCFLASHHWKAFVVFTETLLCF